MPNPGLEHRHSLRLSTPSGPAVLVLHQKGRRFTVEDFEVEGHPGRVLAFSPTGPGVENLDENSEAMQCFGYSTRIRMNGVLLGNVEMTANSFEELAAVLQIAKLRTFDPESI